MLRHLDNQSEEKKLLQKENDALNDFFSKFNGHGPQAGRNANIPISCHLRPDIIMLHVTGL